MRRYKPCSPRLSPSPGHLLAHHGAAGGVDQRVIGVERCSSNRRVLSPRERGFCVVRLVISAPRSLANKFTVLTIEDPNTIDSELVDAPLLVPLVSAPLHKPK